MSAPRKIRIRLGCCITAAAALLALIAQVCVAQASSPTAARDTDNTSQIEQHISATVERYVKWKREWIRDPERVQQLRRQAAYDFEAQETLARLGDRDQMTRIACEVYAKDSRVQSNAIVKLTKIGGYASIKALANIMYNDVQYNSPLTGYYARLRDYAATSLSKLVPDLPVSISVRMGSG